MTPLHENSQPVVIQDEEVRSSRVTNSPLRQLPTASVNRRTALQRFAATAVVGGLGTALTSKIALAHAVLPPPEVQWWLAILGCPRPTAY